MAETRHNSGYLPTLDGWRAIAILGVLLFHDQVRTLGPFSTRLAGQFGWAGVDLFFAISGLLICSRLMEEERKTGAISLKGFYLRRFFRILPAAYLFLAVYSLICAVDHTGIAAGGVVSSMLMVRNLWANWAGDAPNAIYTDHFWSLSIEEHFYLLLPGLLVLVRNRIAMLAGLTLAGCAWAVTVLWNAGSDPRILLWRTDLRLQGLMGAALLGLLLARPRVRARFAKYVKPWSALAVTGAVLALAHVSGHKFWIRPVLLPLSLPLVVASTMLQPAAWISRALEFAPLRFIGRISYGLYLWQQIFLLRDGQPGWLLQATHVFPWNYVLLLACTLLSYYLMERPLMRWGHRLSPPASPGREDIEKRPSSDLSLELA